MTEAETAKAGAPDDLPAAGTRARWAAPLDRLDKAWTRVDAKLCAAVLVAEVLTLFFWVSMKALSVTGRGGPGFVYRCLMTGAFFGAGAWMLSRRGKHAQLVTTLATFLGVYMGRFWGDSGVAYFGNLLAWMQNASILVFFGGVSEIAKRLTLWLALLGASVATGQGKHITVDVVMRFLSPRARVPVAVLGWLVAALVSFFAAWGFFDNLAVEDYHVPTSVKCEGDPTKTCRPKPTETMARVAEDTSRNLFLAGRQLSLDLQSIPVVLSGERYHWMQPKDWNEWLRAGGWEKHFAAEDVKALELPEDGTVDPRTPAVTAVPGGTEQVRGILVALLNMVFPFGLLIIAARFVLRSILALTGWVNVDPDAAHGDEDLAHIHDPGDAAVAAAHLDSPEVAR